MSRTFKSNKAQKAHQFHSWSKTYGYDYDWGYIDLGDYYRFGLKPLENKREKFKAERYVKLKTAHHQRKNCVKGEDKRTENKKHRKLVKGLIHDYIRGNAEDVVATAVGPRNPMQYWS